MEIGSGQDNTLLPKIRIEANDKEVSVIPNLVESIMSKDLETQNLPNVSEPSLDSNVIYVEIHRSNINKQSNSHYVTVYFHWRSL